MRTLDKPLKILGAGDLSAPLFVVADAFTASARTKIEAAGGIVNVLEVPTTADAGASAASRRPTRPQAGRRPKAAAKADVDAEPRRRGRRGGRHGRARRRRAAAEPEAAEPETAEATTAKPAKAAAPKAAAAKAAKPAKADPRQGRPRPTRARPPTRRPPPSPPTASDDAETPAGDA